MKEDCIFCQIAAGKIPATIVYQDDRVIAFRDIHPQSPTHILVIPREHIPSLAEVKRNQVVARLVKVANALAGKEGIKQRGYRVVISSGKEGGQAIPHLHLHLLGGRQLSDALG